jgi:hypothetical protein
MAEEVDTKDLQPDAPSSPSRRHFFSPFVVPVEKVLADPAPERVIQPEVEELKARIAHKVRDDSQHRATLTPGRALPELMPELPRERVVAVATEMGADERYADIKVITTPSGRVYLYSEAHLEQAAAAAKSLLEETRMAVAERIRSDSRDRVALTPANAVHVLLPERERDRLAAFMADLRADERYRDIASVIAPTGDVFFHSDVYLSGRYAAILVRAMGHDPCATIAATVRDESQLYPRPTNVQLFREKAFGISPAELEARIDEALHKPEYADLEKMVHPKTGAVYLYCTRYMGHDQAWWIMNWEEVGREKNP